MDAVSKGGLVSKAKRYSFLKYCSAFFYAAYLILLLFIFVGWGISKILAGHISGWIPNNFLAVPVFFLIAYLAYCILDFPLNFYRSFLLERKFSLSKQKISDWLKDQVKAEVIFYLIAVVLLEAFYLILKYNPHIWWLIISVFWIFFSLILAKLAPIIIIPLFFKYRRLTDNVLRERIVNLADKIKVKILDVFEIDFSKKTLKANAAFVGMGNTKRVILADTLKDRYTYDEIEVILAHEFAHYRLRHLTKLIFINSAAIILSFYLIYKTSSIFVNILGLNSLSDIAALPLVLIYLVIFDIIMQPLNNYVSRRLERNADRLALKVTGLKDAFISMMDKLAAQNLADRQPHPIIKFFFFDHPPVEERINTAKNS